MTLPALELLKKIFYTIFKRDYNKTEIEIESYLKNIEKVYLFIDYKETEFKDLVYSIFEEYLCSILKLNTSLINTSNLNREEYIEFIEATTDKKCKIYNISSSTRIRIAILICIEGFPKLNTIKSEYLDWIFNSSP